MKGKKEKQFRENEGKNKEETQKKKTENKN